MKMRRVIYMTMVGVLLCASVCHAGAEKAFMRKWLLCGPFPNPPNKEAVDDEPHIYDHTPPCVGLDSDYLVAHGGETKIVPVPGMAHTKTDGSKVEWFEHVSPENKIIFRKAITKTPNVVAYAYATVEMEEAGPYLLGLGSDEGVRVWVNGEQIHDKLLKRPIREDDDLVPVILRKGENSILVKVEQGQGGWGFVLRVVPKHEVFTTVATDVQRLKVTVSLRRRVLDRRQGVALSSGGKVVGSGVLEDATGSGIASGSIEVSFSPPGTELGTLAIMVDGENCGEVEVPSLEALRHRTFQWQGMRGYAHCIFVGTEFPRMDFERPLWIEHLIGPYTTSVTYFDAAYNQVERADKPGRYGALVEITPRGGDVHRRYVTLFRQAQNVAWHKEPWTPLPIPLPAGLGIHSGVAEKQESIVVDHLKWSMVSGFLDEPGSAVLLAGLHEMSPDDPPVVHRTGVDSRNQRWWAGLRKTLGVMDTRYLVDLPDGYDADNTKRWPLLLFLHGAGERGDDLGMLRRHGPPKLTDAGEKLPFIVVSPQCPLGTWWQPSELGALLDKIADDYRVDADRVYCTGLSMGGFGTWGLAMEYPTRFAAISPICGGGDVHDVARLKEVPIWAFHGAKDSVVPVERTQKLIDALKELGATPTFTVYPDAYHNSWTETYNNPKLYEWFLKHRLPARGQ